MRDAASELGRRMPVGILNVVDPHPLNWPYLTWNTMEEPARADEKGNIVGAAMEDPHWEGATLVVKDDYTIRLDFPEPGGLALARFRGFRIPGEKFWGEGEGSATGSLAPARDTGEPAEKLTEPAKQIDQLVYGEALSIFLCCPMALVAVNRHVKSRATSPR